MSKEAYKLTFVGAGRMASAIIQSLLRTDEYTPEVIACCSAKDGTAESLSQKTGVRVIDPDHTEPFQTDALILACKPQQLNTVAPSVIASSKGTLLISILAGTRIDKLQAHFPEVRNVVRVMPNTPGSIGAGMSGYACANPMNSNDEATVTQLLASLGEFIAIKEEEMDALTAVSGSGPAYLFLFAECLRDAGIEQGFSPEVATLLANQTLLGASKLLVDQEVSAEELRTQVTSPGGTTHAAIESFLADGFASIVSKAVEAAKVRSIELSKLD
jgi:pyrroline-5-carboxylate reductase